MSLNNNTTMDTDERETYMRAIRRATASKAFDRLLHIGTVIVFLCVAGYLIYQQATYQTGIKRVSEERTQQYNQLLQESDSIKETMACLKRLPVQPDEASITICVDKIKGEN